MQTPDGVVALSTSPLQCGRVVELGSEGSVVIQSDTGEQFKDVEIMHGVTEEVALAAGDNVLLLECDGPGGRAIVLGRIGTSQTQLKRPAEAKEHVPDELVIEAKKNLTLKCGAGSITIREDGKILIKGKDLVSHAQRMNRIRGGSVSIN